MTNKSTKSDRFELQAIKAVVRDNITDEDTASGILEAPAVSQGTKTDVSFDFKTQNLINHDLFSSQVHVIHSVYVDGSATAQFVDNSSGTVDLSQIELTSETAAYTAGTLRLNITNGPDDVSLSNTTNSATTNKQEIKFTSDT